MHCAPLLCCIYKISKKVLNVGVLTKVLYCFIKIFGTAVFLMEPPVYYFMV